MKIEIKARFTGAVLFTHEAEGNTIAVTLTAAVKARAYLAGANLARANLAGANLAGANLARANLAGANLAGAYLDGANLAGAYLDGANLAGANLDGAYLDGAYLARANLAGVYLARAYLAGANLAGAYLDDKSELTGDRPILQIGPIGSRSAYFLAFMTKTGLRFRTGCFFGDRSAFEAKLQAEHSDNQHAQEYRAALVMVEAHAAIWEPKENESKS